MSALAFSDRLKHYSLGISITPLYWRFFRWWGWGWGELQIGPVSVNVGWPIQPED